jgi:hypothetical protein
MLRDFPITFDAAKPKIRSAPCSNRSGLAIGLDDGVGRPADKSPIELVDIGSHGVTTEGSRSRTSRHVVNLVPGNSTRCSRAARSGPTPSLGSWLIVSPMDLPDLSP